MQGVLFQSDALTVQDLRRDPSKVSGYVFKEMDFRWANSNGPAKSARVVSELKTKFNFHVLMHDGGSSGSAESRARALQIEAEQKPGVITAVLQNNVTSRHYVLSPWMLVHRTIHCVQVCGMRVGNQDGLFFFIDKMMAELHGDKYNGSNTTWINPVFGAGNNTHIDFMRFMMTMRSARNMEITNDLDVFAELFTQYQFGGVKLLRAGQWEKRLKQLEATMEMEKRTYSGISLRWDRRTTEMMRDMLEFYTKKQLTAWVVKLERQINAAMAEFTKQLEGKVLTF